MADTTSVWSKSSTTTGCERDQCAPGPRTVDVVTPGETVAVDCMVKGQLIRNGLPGAPDYYEDDRWRRLEGRTHLPQQHVGLPRRAAHGHPRLPGLTATRSGTWRAARRAGTRRTRPDGPAVRARTLATRAVPSAPPVTATADLAGAE